METNMPFQIGSMGCNAGRGIPPAMCTFKDQIHCFYSDPGNKRLTHIRSSDGISWDIAHQVNIANIVGWPSCAVAFRGQLHVFYFSGRGRISHIRSTDGEAWDTPYDIGRASRLGLSVASLNESLVLAYQNHEGDGIMYSKFTGSWKHGNTGHTSRAPRPGIASFGGRYHMFYKDGGDNGANRGIMHIFSDDGDSWAGATPFHVSDTKTSASPTAVAYGDKLHLFYRDDEGNAIFHAASVNGFEYTSADPFNTGLDLDDGPAAAVLGSTLCLAGVEADGARIMRAVYKP